MKTVKKLFALLLFAFSFIQATSQTKPIYAESANPYLTAPEVGNWGKLHYVYNGHFPVVGFDGAPYQYLGYVPQGESGAGVYIKGTGDFTSDKDKVFLISEGGNKKQEVPRTPENMRDNFVAAQLLDVGIKPGSKDWKIVTESANYHSNSAAASTNVPSVTSVANTDTLKIVIPSGANKGIYKGMVVKGYDYDINQNQGTFFCVLESDALSNPAAKHFGIKLYSGQQPLIQELDPNTQKTFMNQLGLGLSSKAQNQNLDISGTWKGEIPGDWTGAVETYIKKTGDNTYIGVNHITWSKPGETSREVKKKFQATLNGNVLNVNEYEFIQKPPGGGALTNFQFKIDNSTGELKLFSPYPFTRSSLTIPQEYEAYISGK